MVNAAPVTPTLSITTGTLAEAAAGSAYTQSIAYSYTGSGTLTFGATGLPAGLSIDTGTGVISGTPAAGTDTSSPYNITVTVGDGTLSDSETYSLVVNAAPVTPTLSITTGTLAEATVGSAYTQSIAYSYTGSGTLTFGATGLPAGLSIDTGTGVISGTPAAGTDTSSPYSIMVEVGDGTLSDSETYSLVVNAAPVTPTHTITATASGGGSISPSGAITVNEGDSQTFTITPNSNYSIASVSVDGVNQGAIPSYTFTNVTEPHTISATFTYTGGGSSGPAYIPRTLTHSTTGVTVSGNNIHSLAQLTVSPLVLHPEDTCAACDAIRKAQKNGQLILGFDISVTPPAIGELTITIPVGSQYNGQTITILHCINGKLETIVATVVNGMVTFTASSLSPFAVTTGLPMPDYEVINPPKTDGAATPIGFVMLGLALLCTGWIVMKRRRAQ